MTRASSVMQESNAITAAQVPASGLLSLDHIAHFVPAIDTAGAALERLGFTLTPFSEQSHRLQPGGPLLPAGTGNRCIMLERGYLEFLTPTGNTPLADQLRVAMQRYVGVHLIAFGTAAPDVDHARLVKEGFEPLEPVALQRPIGTESGEGTARFTVVRVRPGAMAEGRIQYCQQHTPELLWQHRWVQHRNGAMALASVLLCVTDPTEAVQRYSRYTGLPATKTADAWIIETARGALTFTDPATFERAFGSPTPALPWIAGYALESRDLIATRDYLARARIDTHGLPGGRLVVKMPPELGGMLIFQRPDSGPLHVG